MKAELVAKKLEKAKAFVAEECECPEMQAKKAEFAKLLEITREKEGKTYENGNQRVISKKKSGFCAVDYQVLMERQVC